MWVLAGVLVGTTGCGTPAGVEPRVYPGAEDLPDLIDPPPLFASFWTGALHADREGWETVLRPEILDLGRWYLYGYPAASPPGVAAGADRRVDGVAGGTLVEVDLGPNGTGLTLRLALFLPPGPGPHPVFLGLNPCGNWSLLDEEALSPPVSWVQADCPEGAGSQAEMWPVAEILARGYALAAVHQSDIVADDVDLSDTVGAIATVPTEAPAWGAVAAWAWGLSRVVDHLVERSDVDPARIAVVGHSRRGKAALLAAVSDDRIALAIPHQSGTCGATLTRSDLGEPISVITTLFPHWLSDVLPTFADDEDRVPVDQHQILALLAPRPVLLGNADDDSWADPPGALRAAQLASPAWEVYGTEGLAEEDGVPTTAGRIGWFSRPGGHGMTEEDWSYFLDFADRWL